MISKNLIKLLIDYVIVKIFRFKEKPSKSWNLRQKAYGVLLDMEKKNIKKFLNFMDMQKSYAHYKKFEHRMNTF